MANMLTRYFKTDHDRIMLGRSSYKYAQFTVTIFWHGVELGEGVEVSAGGGGQGGRHGEQVPHPQVGGGGVVVRPGEGGVTRLRWVRGNAT